MNLLNEFTACALTLTLPLIAVVWVIARRTRYYGNRGPADLFWREFHNWIFISLLGVAVSRAFVAAAKYGAGTNLWYVSYLFPIKIGGPNWGILSGFPYLFACTLVLWRLPFVLDWLRKPKRPDLRLVFFTLLFSLAFGAIQGGLIDGITSFFHSSTHIHDAQVFNFTWSDILAHDYRRYTNHTPHYLASHFKTHPPFTLALWSFFVKYLSVDTFAFFCTAIFVSMIYCVYAVFKNQFGKDQAVYTA